MVDCTKRYCIIGGGPSGLLTARAFKFAGILYDQFERHTDVGGIWDIDNPGSSMYDSAHFIASRFTSGFYGYPMPNTFPDYPGHHQILDYIRNFTSAYNLKAQIEFNTSVIHATPVGTDAKDGWEVLLSSGESRTYKGIVCTNGVTWHPQMPAYPNMGKYKGDLCHSVSYRNSAEFQDKRVLIIGAGNSGVDIACDAATSANTATISLRRGYHFVPKHIFGLPTDVFLSGKEGLPEGVTIPQDPSKMLEALVGDLTRYGLSAPDHKVLESHPIMNSQILHHLAHGDINAKGEIHAFTETGVIFADGSEESFDLILCATGYEYRIPFLNKDLFNWKMGHPELYLNIFHRHLPGLAVVGFVEFASAGYQRFDEMAQMVAMDASIEMFGEGQCEWKRMKSEEFPNLRGTTNYIDSPRHANYVDVDCYRDVLSNIFSKFNWPEPNDDFYSINKGVS